MIWPIIFCSVLAGAVFLERATYFHRITMRLGEFMRGLANLIEHRRFSEAQMECASTPTPVTRVIHAALLRHQTSRAELKDIVTEAGQLEVPRLERRLGLLATIAFVAPLLGLLGTVIGLIDAFLKVSAQSGFAGSTDIATGIYQSLLATAAGLIVAIPCAVGYSYLSARVNAHMHDLERAGIEIVNLLTEHRRSPGPEIIEFGPAPRATRQGAE